MVWFEVIENVLIGSKSDIEKNRKVSHTDLLKSYNTIYRYWTIDIFVFIENLSEGSKMHRKNFSLISR